MKEKIFNNLALKILSALCAVVLWTVIVNIYDPTASVTISNVSVQLINAESLTDKNYTYEVIDGEKISVYISGPKSVITDIKSSDIVATADLSKISAFADYVDINVKVVKEGQVLQNVDVSPKTSAVKLNIENRITKEFNITPEISGKVADGYTVVSKDVTPGTIKVTGSTSSVEQIDDVKAYCDVNGATGDVSDNVNVTFYDAEGNEYTDTKLDLSVSEVAVSASVRKVKEIPLKFEGTTGEVAQGYVVKSYKSRSENVVVIGEDSALSQISEIVVPASALDITGLKEDKVVSVDVSSYIPEGLSIVGSKTVIVDVTVSILENKTLVLDKSKFVVENLANGLTLATSLSGRMDVVISGPRDIVEELTADSVKAKLDLSGLSAGNNEVKVNFELPQGCLVEGEHFTTVDISANGN